MRSWRRALSYGPPKAQRLCRRTQHGSLALVRGQGPAGQRLPRGSVLAEQRITAIEGLGVLYQWKNSRQQQGEVNLFKATVEALELDGIHLLNPEKAAQEEAQVEEEASNAEPQVTRRLSLKEIFAMERERTSNLSDKTPSDDNIK